MFFNIIDFKTILLLFWAILTYFPALTARRLHFYIQIHSPIFEATFYPWSCLDFTLSLATFCVMQ